MRKTGIYYLLLLTTIYLLSAQISYAQIGGPHEPLSRSTHTYTVTMFNVGYTASWYIYADGTDIFNIDSRTALITLGNGSKTAGVASIPITFNTPDYTIGTTYTLVYEEKEPSSLICDNYRFYSVTILPTIDINSTSVPPSVCAIQPLGYSYNPTGPIACIATYVVELQAPIGYGYNWNFSYNITASASRVGFANAMFHRIQYSGTGYPGGVFILDAPDAQGVVSGIPPTTTAITLIVEYTLDPGSEQDIKFTILNQEGSYLEKDNENPQTKNHKILRIPAPSALLTVD